LVRSGTTYGRDRILGALSLDAGASWTGFPAQPPPPDETRPFTTGPIAIAADGSAIVWTTRGNPPHLTRDRGKSWQPVEGAPVDLRVAFDRVDPAMFYGYDAVQGVFFGGEVGPGGAVMSPRLSALPTVQKRRGPTYAELLAVPEKKGELWLAIDGALVHFTDFGRAFARVATAENVSAIGFGMAAPGRAYPALFIAGKVAGTHGIHRSDDGGASFVRVNDDAHQFGAIKRLTGDPRVFGRVYCATGGRGIVYGSLEP
jgi:hypothetical protein